MTRRALQPGLRPGPPRSPPDRGAPPPSLATERQPRQPWLNSSAKFQLSCFKTPQRLLRPNFPSTTGPVCFGGRKLSMKTQNKEIGVINVCPRYFLSHCTRGSRKSSEAWVTGFTISATLSFTHIFGAFMMAQPVVIFQVCGPLAIGSPVKAGV